MRLALSFLFAVVAVSLLAHHAMSFQYTLLTNVNGYQWSSSNGTAADEVTNPNENGPSFQTQCVDRFFFKPIKYHFPYLTSNLYGQTIKFVYNIQITGASGQVTWKRTQYQVFQAGYQEGDPTYTRVAFAFDESISGLIGNRFSVNVLNFQVWVGQNQVAWQQGLIEFDFTGDGYITPVGEVELYGNVPQALDDNNLPTGPFDILEFFFFSFNV